VKSGWIGVMEEKVEKRDEIIRVLRDLLGDKGCK
jgi:hypothetical protein